MKPLKTFNSKAYLTESTILLFYGESIDFEKVTVPWPHQRSVRAQTAAPAPELVLLIEHRDYPSCGLVD